MPSPRNDAQGRLPSGWIAFAASWIALLVGSLAWDAHQVRRSTAALAVVEARASFEKDVLYRRWAAMHGGVYVPPTERTPPNSFLADIPDRDVTTTAGKQLTLVNPAYMTRQVHELGHEHGGTSGHITSLKPIRPENAPDAWERWALGAFERGTSEVSSIETLDGQRQLRLMRPLVTEASCLQCHATQGYRVGDVRGGISVSVPFAPYAAAARTSLVHRALGHFVIGVLGLAGIGIAFWRLRAKEAALGASEAQLASALELGRLGHWEYDVASDRFTFSDQFYKIFRSSARAVGGHSMTSSEYAERFVHPDDRSVVADEIAKVLATADPDYSRQLEHRIVFADGSEGHINVRFSAVKDGSGRTIRTFGVNQDITERKRAEEALRASEERFRMIFDYGQFGVTLADSRFRFVAVNPAFCRMIGYSESELRDLTFADITPPDRVQTDRANVVAMAQGKQSVYRTEKEYLRKDGRRFWGSLVTSPIHDSQGKVTLYVALVQDISEQKRAEAEKEVLQAQLLQAQKMESVGRLAGGVAHDFNNMLQAILGNIELALTRTSVDAALRRELEEVRRAAERSAELTRQLLAFARKQAVAPKILDLNVAVSGTLGMLRRLIGEDVDLSWTPGPGLCSVRIDPSQLDQILANLCVNARDALVGPGRIDIRTENVAVTNEPGGGPGQTVSGEFVRLSISDNGCGMEEEVIAHLFEPFFTTKGVGRGTGLGLATVYGIVTQSNGFIRVESQPGQGTSFKVFLPRHLGRAIREEGPSGSGRPSGGYETVLLVEDERALLEMGQDMLQRLGYTVLSAATPGEALRVAEQHAGEIHLLLTDVVMPEMNGRDLFARVGGLRPKMACLFMSGYSSDVIAQASLEAGELRFIQKPFSMETLALRVREALDAAGQRRQG